MQDWRPLRADEIETLAAQGCSAGDWTQVTVAAGFDPARVRRVAFLGRVAIGRLAGEVRHPDGLDKPSCIENAVIADCAIGDGCRIANIGVHLAGYDIGAGACVEDVGLMQTRPGATFGNGIEVDVLNEAGGRGVLLFDELSAQFAYLMCLHRHRPAVVERLAAIARARAGAARADRGSVGAGAYVGSVREIADVRIGPAAIVTGAMSLRNGTVLSSAAAPARVGSGVIAHEFIIAEGASVGGGAILGKAFVGQGCQIGKQFSAENSLFFANCEGFHGEACSVFAGPYTVTHHKSTLLIAGLFSFYNAGSGTNQSNHRYKVGPVHEGKLARGSKTGSFAYMMWPCRVGPFSVVLGKHGSTFDTLEYPFSVIEAMPDGRANMIPGLNLTTVGTVRDGAKWASRDRRKGPVKRDILTIDVFSPYTVGLMLRGSANLKRLEAETDRSVEEVNVGGAVVRRALLRTGQKYYRTGIEVYLLEKVFERLERGAGEPRAALAADPAALSSKVWVDIGGQLMPQARLDALEAALESGAIADLAGFEAAIAGARDRHGADEWAWVRDAVRDALGIDLDAAGRDQLLALIDTYGKAKGKFLRLVLADAEREFDEVSRLAFGQDGPPEAAAADFAAVRGGYEENKFVREVRAQIEAVERRVSALKGQLAAAVL